RGVSAVAGWGMSGQGLTGQGLTVSLRWRLGSALLRARSLRGAMALSRRPGRSRPIRLFLISMFVVPLVSLLALWGFAASITVSNAISDHEYNVSAAALTSGVRGLIIALPQERVQSYFWLNSGRTTSRTSMLTARHILD